MDEIKGMPQTIKGGFNVWTVVYIAPNREKRQLKMLLGAEGFLVK